MSRLYFDYQASTPVDPLVLDAMLPYFNEKFGNPHALEHDFGMDAHNAVEAARQKLGAAIGAATDEIIFTSGATESNNLALRGLLDRPSHIISCTTEHDSVLSTLKALEAQGVNITLVNVDSSGMIDPDDIRNAITPKTKLVSIMSVNNETGVIHNVDEIGTVCDEFGIPLHTDGAQALGKVPIDVKHQNISMMSLSSHKAYGPKGIGAFYCSAELKKKLNPILWGGGQEGGLRPGTIPTPLAVGFGTAAELATQNMDEENRRISAFRDRFLEALASQCDNIRVNGSIEHRIAGNLNLCIEGVDAESLLHMMPNIAISTGSACSSAATEPSHVLLAMGMSYDDASSSIRIGFGRYTTEAEVIAAVDGLAAIIKRLKRTDKV